MENKFTEADKRQLVDFLNFIAIRARFPTDWKTEDSVTHFKLLAYMQNVILPKIDANILEVIQVRKAEDKSEKASKK